MSAATMAPPDQDEQLFDALAFENRQADVKTPRWIVFMGDAIPPERKRELKHLAAGGDENAAKTLAPTKGFIRRGRLVPMVSWIERLPKEEMPGQLPGVVLEFSGIDANASTLVSARQMSGFERHPGQDLTSVLQLDVNQVQRQGVVEISTLKGADYRDPEIKALEAHFFPKAEDVIVRGEGVLAGSRPVKLAAMAAKVEAVLRQNGNTSTLGRIAQAMLASCEMFRLWGERRLDVESQMIRAGVVPGTGHTHSYSGLARTLFEILDVAPVADAATVAMQREQRQSEAFDRLADVVASQAGGTDILKAFLEEQRLARETHERLIQSLIGKQFDGEAGNGQKSKK